MRSIEKQFYLNTKKYFPDCSIDSLTMEITIRNNDQHLITLSYRIRMLAENEILTYNLKISFKEVENKWLNFRDELMYPNSRPTTIFVTLEKFAPNFFQFYGLNLAENEVQNFEEIFDTIHLQLTIPMIEKYSDIENVDSIINPINNIASEGIRTEQVYPIRAVIVAQMANNPRLSEIIKDMRKYCQDSYEMGIKDNYVPATKLLPVFEKMFGK